MNRAQTDQACELHIQDLYRVYAPEQYRKLFGEKSRKPRAVPRPAPRPAPKVIELPAFLPPKDPERRELLAGCQAPTEILAIVETICRQHKTNWLQMRTWRKDNAIRARTALYVALRARGWSTTRTGKFIGRDHTSVVHALQKWDRAQ